MRAERFVQFLPPEIQDESIKHMPWVKSKKSSAYYFQSEPLKINATPEVVWEVVKDIENYDKYSNGTIRAHVDGEPQVNKTIALDLYKNQLLGIMIPSSKERISIVDNERKILGWERDLPLCSGTTERYQVLETDDEQNTKSYIALKIPGRVGFFTNLVLKKPIEDAFNKINKGIKEAAEEKQQLLMKT
jgi:hypothetical protein